MGGLFRILLRLGFVVKFWWLLLLLSSFAAAGVAVWFCRMHHTTAIERRHPAQRAIVARADQQHAWTLAGDDRGVYGDYRPEVYPTG